MAHSCKIRSWPFRGCLERLGQEEAEMLCKCRQRRARLHPFSFPTARPNRAKLFNIDKKKPLTLSEIFGSPEGVRLFAGWAPQTKLFGRSESSAEASETQEKLSVGSWSWRWGSKKILDKRSIYSVKHHVLTCIIDLTAFSGLYIDPPYSLSDMLSPRALLLDISRHMPASRAALALNKSLSLSLSLI